MQPPSTQHQPEVGSALSLGDADGLVSSEAAVLERAQVLEVVGLGREHDAVVRLVLDQERVVVSDQEPGQIS